MTECPIISRVEKGKYVEGSVGKLLFNMRAKFVDEGRVVGKGERGEIWVQGTTQVFGCYSRNLSLNL